MTYKLDLTARREASIQKLISAGDALRAAGQYDAAIATYRRVLTIEAGNQRALHGIEGVEADRRHAAMVAEAAKDFERKDYDAADAILQDPCSMRIRASGPRRPLPPRSMWRAAP